MPGIPDVGRTCSLAFQYRVRRRPPFFDRTLLFVHRVFSAMYNVRGVHARLNFTTVFRSVQDSLSVSCSSPAQPWEGYGVGIGLLVWSHVRFEAKARDSGARLAIRVLLLDIHPACVPCGLGAKLNASMDGPGPDCGRTRRAGLKANDAG
jgi:hypothetical protein